MFDRGLWLRGDRREGRSAGYSVLILKKFGMFDIVARTEHTEDFFRMVVGTGWSWSLGGYPSGYFGRNIGGC